MFEMDPLGPESASVRELVTLSGAWALACAPCLSDLLEVDAQGQAVTSRGIRRSIAGQQSGLMRAIELISGPRFFDKDSMSEMATSIKGRMLKNIKPLPSLQHLPYTADEFNDQNNDWTR